MALAQHPAIAFIGFMGAGKSTAARAAAAALGQSVVDVDEAIEAKLGESIANVFERDGETAFRRLEEEVTLDLLRHGGVLALGGGAVESEAIRTALSDHVVAWCRVDEQTAWKRSRGTGRPLAAARNLFAERFNRRAPMYRSLARMTLPEGGHVIGREAAPWLAAMTESPGVRIAWAKSESGSYPAVVGIGAVGLLESEWSRGALPKRLFAVADSNALAHYGELLPSVAGLIEVDGNASPKSLAEAERVLRELAAQGARRDDALIALGGGVVGDLAGFCAATYQRGVPVIQVPTTLVAQVDAAYGGKTGVDLPEAKNYVGAFHLPSAVLADPATLASLPREELAAGYAEVLKTALIAGGDLWARVREIDELNPSALEEIVFACALTKLDVVAADERDTGRRAVLNLGHSVGHAVEAATGYKRFRHGEAVGLGLLAALRLSGASELRTEVAELLERQGLPTRIEPATSIDAVIDALARDKKSTATGVAFVLLERAGEPREGQLVDDASVRAAVAELMD